jgi:hypothetical protein
VIDYEFIFRACAVVAAVAVVAGPRLVAAIKKVRLPSPAPGKAVEMSDAHTILEIASRLKVAGNKKGVALCQQLIDVILQPEGKA